MELESWKVVQWPLTLISSICGDTTFGIKETGAMVIFSNQGRPTFICLFPTPTPAMISFKRATYSDNQ